MATIQDIKNQMTQDWMSDPNIRATYQLDPNKTFEEQFSKVSLESIKFYIVAYGIYLFTQVLNSDKSYIENVIKEMKPHRIKWYINKVKAFQLGDSLSVDSDVYAIVDENKQVVKYCNIVEKYGYLLIKIAGEINNLPSKLDDSVVNAVTSYINKVKDAGVHYDLICREADLYRTNIRIHYDPLLLSSNGERIDGTDTEPIKKTVENYLKSMPFDSKYSKIGDVAIELNGCTFGSISIDELCYNTKIKTNNTSFGELNFIDLSKQ